MAEKKAARKSATPAIIDAQPEDVRLTTTDGTQLLEWFKGLGPFFVRATQLETQAIATRDEARSLKAPTNSIEDEAIQRFVKRTTAEKKDVEEHWTITSLINRLHKRMTAKRGIATSALEEANATGNRLHAAYVEAERRRAEQEAERRRREEEERARQQRERELQQAENDAIAREEAAADLSDREARFVDLVFGGLNSPQTAARSVGYKDPAASAARLMNTPKIVAAIKGKQEAAAIRQQAVARAQAPLEVREAEPVRADITKAAGATDRVTHSGVIISHAACVEAFRSGQYGIPGDLFIVDQTKLNEYARSMGPLLDRWPGVQYKKKTSVI